jgi:hypothetical protein
MNGGVTEQVVVDKRFLGPPGHVNGGYACGLVASRIGRSAGVNLRKPIPIEKSLVVDASNGGVRMLFEDEMIADGGPADPVSEVPDPVPFELAREAESRFAFLHDHPFPECFVCGPAREPGDGLRIFPGKIDGRDVVAGGWVPDVSVPSADGAIDDLITWAVLDCPTSFGSALGGEQGLSMIARLEARLLEPVRIGEQHVAIGWPIEREGRKWWGGSALFGPAGELCAHARGLWIELREPPPV